MNNLNNPFVPKGTLLDLQDRRRKQFKIAVFCALSVGVVGLATMLGVQGCKRENPANQFENSAGTEFAASTNLTLNVDTNNLPPLSSTNAVAYNPPVETNTLPTNMPPTELPPVNTGGSEYKIQKGDTLAVIAKKNGVNWKAIQAANPKLDPKRLKVGTMITIPAATAKSASSSTTAAADGATYSVKAGDNLGKIAKAHHTTVKAIKAANNLKTERINVGQKLVIPAKAEAAPAAPAVTTMPEPMVAPPTAPAISPVPPTTAPAK